MSDGAVPAFTVDGLDDEGVFRFLIGKRIEAARLLDTAAANFSEAFGLWVAAGALVDAAWPEELQSRFADYPALRDLRHGAWVLPLAVQCLLVDGGENAAGSLEERERAAFAPHLQ